MLTAGEAGRGGARHRERPRRWLPWALAVALLLAGCREAEQLLQRVEPATAHERYADGLRRAGLEGTALGAWWLAAADTALARPVTSTLPLREAAFFGADEARAAGFRFAARGGQRLVVALERDGAAAPVVFVDLFEVPRDTLDPLRLVASADSTADSLAHVVRRDGEFVLRVQPELLRAGRWVVTVRQEPSLAAFPVQGRDARAVRSFFGADRDGGRRVHHGIDIFAPRGTPVVAATEGYVRSTRPNTLGGNVVWLWDTRQEQSLYYAHLDTVLVAQGTRVEPGDTLGLVGNSGNARSTPPHLHFGVYRRGQGPMDPFPFVHVARRTPPEIRASVERLGQAARLRAASAITGGATAGAAGDGAAAELPAGTPLRLVGAAGSSYRVRLPDGREGYLPARLLEARDDALGSERVATATAVRAHPAALAATVDSVAAGSELPVLGRWAGYALVRTAGGREGWVDGS